MKPAVVPVRTVLEGLHEAGCCPSVNDLVLERLHEAGCRPSVYDLVLEGLHEAGCCPSVPVCTTLSLRDSMKLAVVPV